MNIFVRTTTGYNLTLLVEATDTIGSIKKKVSEKNGKRTDLIELYLSGVILKDEDTVSQHSITEDSILMMVITVDGGFAQHAGHRKARLSTLLI
jgi:Ubiquitin family